MWLVAAGAKKRNSKPLSIDNQANSVKFMTLIKNATIVNEGKIFKGSVLIENEKIARIIPEEEKDLLDNICCEKTVDAEGCILMPGVIDTHVHFRDSGIAPEPGKEPAADFATESRAAVAGGVTSVVDMPNTVPQTTSLELLEAKERMAAEKSVVNYGFMVGATNDNIDHILEIDPKRYAAIKLFLGSSTGNMLVNNAEVLDKLFKESKKLIVAHCESEDIIQANLRQYKAEYGNLTNEQLEAYNAKLMQEYELMKAEREEFPDSDAPSPNKPNLIQNLAELHPMIRNTQACYLSTYHAIERALKYKTRLHIAHISTATELGLLNSQPLTEKHITAEVTPNHLCFDSNDYKELGNLIKCNPAIKTGDDRLALWAALYDGLIDTVGSDHAPHPLASKQKNFFEAPGGIPSIQHELVMMLETFFNPASLEAEKEECGTADFSPLSSGLIKEWLPLIVEKMSHNPAMLFGIEGRGFIREGYYADLVLVRPEVEQTITRECLKYKCGWSPLVGMKFHTRVEKTFVNGNLAYDCQTPDAEYSNKGIQLIYSK